MSSNLRPVTYKVLVDGEARDVYSVAGTTLTNFEIGDLQWSVVLPANLDRQGLVFS